MKRLLLTTAAAAVSVILAVAPAQAATWQAHRADPRGQAWISTSATASAWSTDISDSVGPLPSFVPNP